jgi:hypothetical protein
MNLIAILFLLAIAAGVALGIYWLIWTAWCYVLPYFWAAGPENFIKPDFWMFVLAALLLSWLGRVLFKHDKSK